jgi:SET domain-containing protein
MTAILMRDVLKPASGTGPRFVVRRSGVHGRGVFALRRLVAGETIVEYTGELITWDEAVRRHPHDPADPHHTFYFQLERGGVIDASSFGNSSRWINHSCEPNCLSDEVDGQVFIRALRDIEPREELFYDYRLSIDGRYTKNLKRDYACRCGASRCRGTLLLPKR